MAPYYIASIGAALPVSDKTANGTGQECGASEETLSAAHIFPCRPRQPPGAEAFPLSCTPPPPTHFPPFCRMAERPPSRPRVAREEVGAPQESSSPPEPYEVTVVQLLQIGE